MPKYPYRPRCLFTEGQRQALQKIMTDPEWRPTGTDGRPVSVDSINGLIRYFVFDGIARTGMPLGPVEADGEWSLGPVEAERDTVQRERERAAAERVRRSREATEADVKRARRPLQDKNKGETS